MRKLILIVSLLFSLVSQAQTWNGDFLNARKRFTLKNYWVTDIKSDTFNWNVSGIRYLPTAKAVYDFVIGRTAGIVGGGSQNLNQVAGLDSSTSHRLLYGSYFFDGYHRRYAQSTLVSAAYVDTLEDHIVVKNMSPNHFKKVHSSIVVNDTIFLGERFWQGGNPSKIIRYNNVNDLTDTSQVSIADGGQFDFVTYDSSRRKLYYTSSKEGSGVVQPLRILQLDPATMGLSQVFYSAIIDSVSTSTSPPLVTDDNFVFVATARPDVAVKIFKIQISTWTIVDSVQVPGAYFAHSMSVGKYSWGNEIYITAGSKFIKLNASTMAYVVVDLSRHVQSITDDIVFKKVNDAGGLLYLPNESSTPAYEKSSIILNTETLALTAFSALPSYGFFTDGTHLYNAGSDGYIQLIPYFNAYAAYQPIAYTARGFFPNEIVFAGGKMFFTHWQNNEDPDKSGKLVEFQLSNTSGTEILPLRTSNITKGEYSQDVKFKTRYLIKDMYARGDSAFYNRGDGEYFAFLLNAGSSMVYPGAGIPVSTGSAWGTSIINNSANWDAAYGWGNHAGLYPINSRFLDSLLAHTARFNGVTGELAGKQATLVSGTNLKTVNGNSLLGTGDVPISGADGYVDGGVFNPATNTLTITQTGAPDVNISMPSTEIQNPRHPDSLAVEVDSNTIMIKGVTAQSTHPDISVTMKRTDTLNTIEIGMVNREVLLATFTAGAGFAVDTTVFTDSTIYGSLYTGLDTFYITRIVAVIKGAAGDSLQIRLSFNDSINIAGTNLTSSDIPVNDRYTGNVVTTIANYKIPHQTWLWMKSPTIIAGKKPEYLSVAIMGYRKPASL